MRGALVMAGLLLVGCTVGPDFDDPEPDVPSDFNATEAQASARAAQPAPTPELAWWRRFDDPLLTDLIETAVGANTDLAAARARVREARALRRVAGADALPRARAGGQARRAAVSEEGPGATGTFIEQGLADRQTSLFTTQFDASWELDLFGQTRRAVEAADARFRAAREQRRDVLLTVVADVARVYFELRGAQRRLETARRNIRIQRETLELVQSQFDSGLVPRLDVAQARRRLERTRASVPPQRAAIRVNAHALARLLGQSPARLIDRLRQVKPLPSTPQAIPVGLPVELLGRRPDLRAARARLHAATADVGVAVARLYPDISITGALGLESDNLGDLFQSSAGLWSFGGALDWAIFEGGALRGNIDANEARLKEVEARYQGTVLRALEDVESDLVRYAEAREEAARLREAVEASREALRQARVLYDRGLSDFIDVLEAQSALTELEDQLAAQETAVVVNLVALYKSLGGGWGAVEKPERAARS